MTNRVLQLVGMAGTSDHFLNSPGFVYGYIGMDDFNTPKTTFATDI
jgi:hypothetical protein